MSKKVTFAKPPKEKQADEWVQSGAIESEALPVDNEEDKEPSKRITLDIPQSWHTQIKVACAKKGVKMTAEILPLLKKHFDIKT